MLAHKVKRAKWEPKKYVAENEISADALTGCFRTSDNTLSCWYCSNERDDVAEIALALSVEITKEKFDTFDVALLPQEDLVTAGLATEETPGKTLVQDLQSRHVDVIHLDAERLTRIAKLFAPRIRNGNFIYRFSAGQIKGLVLAAIRNERLDPSDLHEKLQEKLGIK